MENKNINLKKKKETTTELVIQTFYIEHFYLISQDWF